MKEFFIKIICRKFGDYYLPVTGLILILFVVSVIFPKSESFLVINKLQSPVGVILFKYITLLGNSAVYIIMIIACLFIRFRFSLIYLMTFAIEGSLSQFLKKVVFTDVYRPLKFFELQGIEIQLAEGVRLYKHYSFPSGHSATAFAFFTLTALLILPVRLRFLSIILAFLTAFSRVYLGQHFIPDIAAGSFLGLMVATFVYWWMNIYRPAFTEKLSWIDKKIRL